MASNDFSMWYRSIPQISRYWFTGSVVLPLIGKLGLISPLFCILSYELIFHHFQIWRPVTALFYYPVTPQTGFQYLMNLYFMYSYSTRLEMGLFAGQPADFLFMLIFLWLCLVAIGLVFGLMLLMDPMILAVLYIWCQANKDQIVQFWFGTQFKAMYLPWILVAFNMIIRGGGMGELIGIFVGHLYFFLMFKYPQDYGGARLISTPQFLYNYFPNIRGGSGGFGQPPISRRQQPADGGGRHPWGAGNQLGN